MHKSRKSMDREFIIVRLHGITDVIFNDFYSDERATVWMARKDSRFKIINFIQRIHFSPLMNRNIDIPFKRIWCNSLKKIDWQTDVEYFLFFVNTSIYPIKPSELAELQTKYNIKLVMLIWDKWDSADCDQVKEYLSEIKFDYVLDFDILDAKNNGFIYTYLPYSILYDVDTNVQYDLYMAGSDKGRLTEILEIYKQAKNHGVTEKFRIYKAKRKDQKYKNEITYNKYISYKTLVEETVKSNCILEMLVENQTGATLRYYEAVCYNKKLLTNNKYVVDFPFYNPNYIHVYDNIDDINWNWVTERIPVDYHYDGRFSPSKLIDYIIDLEENTGN